MSSIATISHEERLLPQCFSMSDVTIKRVYRLGLQLLGVSVNLQGGLPEHQNTRWLKLSLLYTLYVQRFMNILYPTLMLGMPQTLLPTQ